MSTDKTVRIPIWGQADPADVDVRGRVLVAGAAAEALMLPLIQSYLLDCKATENLLDGPFAPLGTFSAQIAMARSLGLITEDEFADLNLIRRVRNDFAHQVEIDSSSRSFKDRCTNLKSVPQNRPKIESDWIAFLEDSVKHLCLRIGLRVPTIMTERLSDFHMLDGDHEFDTEVIEVEPGLLGIKVGPVKKLDD